MKGRSASVIRAAGGTVLADCQQIKLFCKKSIASKGLPRRFQKGDGSPLARRRPVQAFAPHLYNRLEIEYSTNDDLISKLDIYSKNIISRYKTSSNDYNSTKSKSITKEQSKEYANNVYQKLENYVITNNIEEQDRYDTSLPINLIPASSDNTIYPNLDSWYYIKNKQVFAYIAIDTKDQTYGWCYSGGIDNYKEGEC